MAAAHCSLHWIATGSPRPLLSMHFLHQDLNSSNHISQVSSMQSPTEWHLFQSYSNGMLLCTVQILEWTLYMYTYITAPGLCLCRLRNPQQHEQLLLLNEPCAPLFPIKKGPWSMPRDVPHKAIMASSSSRICHFASSMPLAVAAYCPLGHYIDCGRTHKVEPPLPLTCVLRPQVNILSSVFLSFLSSYRLSVCCTLRLSSVLWFPTLTTRFLSSPMYIKCSFQCHISFLLLFSYLFIASPWLLS